MCKNLNGIPEDFALHPIQTNSTLRTAAPVRRTTYGNGLLPLIALFRVGLPLKLYILGFSYEMSITSLLQVHNALK
jgi:hypothetical protein